MTVALWAGWTHTANSIETRGGDWQFSFSISEINGGAFVGVVPGTAAPIYPDAAWFGIRIERVSAATIRVGLVARNPVTGASAVVATSTSAETQFHIAHFQGQIYLTAGSGTRTADDGSTSLDGATLLGQYNSGYAGATRLVAAFSLPADSITGYTWEGLSSAGEPVFNIIADASDGPLTVTLPSSPSTGDTVRITAEGGDVTVDGGAETIDGSGDDYVIDEGDTVEFVYDGTTWVSEEQNDDPVEGGFTVTDDVSLDDLVDVAQASLIVGPLQFVGSARTPVSYIVDGAIDLEDLATTEGLDTGTVELETTPVDPPDNGTVTINPDGTFTYESDPGFEGTDTFTYEATDDSGGTYTGTVTIVIDPDADPVVTVTGDYVDTGETTVVQAPPAAGETAYANLTMAPFRVEAYEDSPTLENFVSSTNFLHLMAFGTAEDISARGIMAFEPWRVIAADDDTYNYAFMTMAPFTITAAAGATAPAATPYFNVLLGNTFSGNAAGGGLYDIAEEVLGAGTVHENYAIVIRDIARAMGSAQTFYQTTLLVGEAILAGAMARSDFIVSLPEEISAADTLQLTDAVQLVEAIQVATGAETFYQGVAEVADALQAAGASAWAISGKLAEVLNTGDDVVALLTRVAEVLDALSIEDEITTGVSIVVTENVSVEIADGVDVLGHYLANISEHSNIWVGFKLGDEAFTGWVMNTEGSRPISEYTDYPFNSFCELEGAYYGAAEDGLYRLDGPDDAGADINASVLTMMTDFNSTKMKRVPTAYVGYTADGKMVLRVRAVSGGELREHWFTATERTANAPREQVIQLGRGIRSRYWQFELANADGADFEIDKLELYPVYLNRRV